METFNENYLMFRILDAIMLGGYVVLIKQAGTRHAVGQKRQGRPITFQANLRCNTRACRVKLALVMHRDTLSMARPAGG